MVKIITNTVLANFPNPSDFQGFTQNPSKNMPRLTRLAAMSARAIPQNQPPYTPCNILSTPETSSHLNVPYPTTPAMMLVRTTS